MELSKTTNLIVPILPNISNMEFHSVFDSIEDDKLFPDYKHWRKDMISIFIKHNISKINGIGHSFGSIVLSIILKDKTINRFIDKRVFIDPVCFVYDSYKTFRYLNQPDPRGGVVTKVFNQLIYKDPYVRYAAQRFLHGPEFWLDENYDNLKDNTLVILSWNDQLVASDSIYKQLRKYGVPCIIVNQAHHSEIFFNDNFEAVLQIITRFIELDHK